MPVVTGTIAAINTFYNAAEKSGLAQEVRTAASNTFYRREKRATAEIAACEVFVLASNCIRDCPDGRRFDAIARWWFLKVLELLEKWDRLDKKLADDFTNLGADINRLKDADWYNIRKTAGNFTRKSKIGGRRWHKIGSTSVDVTQQAGKLLKIYTDHLKGKLDYEPLQACCEFPVMKNMNEFIDFECREETMGRIRSSIHNHSGNFTQIYGAGGIGKTIMLVKIAQDIESTSNEFTRVVYVEVSRSPNIFQMQQKIAFQIGQPLEDTNEDVARRAHTLKRSINNTGENTEKVLVVLDDVWEHLSMQEIGIPSGGKVKVVIGTRMSNLRWQDRDDKIQVGLLTGEDPWKIFKGAAGLVGTEIVIRTAEEVAKECFGLPLALAVIGSTLSGETDLSTWKQALDYLKKSKIKKLRGKVDVEELLCKVIKYSYDYLDTNKVPMAKEDKIARDIFRLCCLFPENHDIPRDDLKKYLLAEHAKLKSNDFDYAILRLFKCHLLRSTVEPGVLKMHAVVRDVAVYITKEEDSAFINCGTANKKTELSEETVTSNKTVSVMRSNIKETVGFKESSLIERVTAYVREKIAKKAEFAKVRILLLRGNTGLDKLPGSFFQRMGDLIVLDLSESAINGLPPSMNKLNKVQTLLLNGCKDLKDVREIVKLSGLRVLSLRESALKSLPIGMKNLVNLVVLEFSPAGDCDRDILDGFFSGLPQLQELFLASEHLSDKTFMEIIELQKMKALRLCVYSNVLSSVEFVNKFKDGEPLPKWSEFTIFFKKRDNPPALASEFTISGHLNYPSMSQKKNLHIMELPKANSGVKLLLREAENLIIEESFSQEITLDFLTLQGEKIFEKTKSLHLKNCGTIQYLSSGGSSQWENLEELELTELKEFEGIFQDVVSAGSFAILREITFRTCEKICYVMPDNIVQKVHERLQKIKVIKCDMVGYIFDHHPNYSGSFSVLKLIELRGMLILTTIWREIPPQGTFAELKELIVIECHKLAYVLTTSVANILTSLQKLTVVNNRELKAIVQWDGTDNLNRQVFPSVTHLSIQKLENLKYFHGEPRDIDLDWPSLVQLRLGACDTLTRFPIGKASAPYMKLVHVTSETDKPSTWYKELETTAPRFTIRVAYDLTEDV